MEKFCTKCGKPLKEEEVCECTNSVGEKVSIKDSTTTIDIQASFIDCLEVFKKVITNPFEAISNFVMENKYISGIVMIVIAALSAGIYKLAVLKCSYQAVETSLDGLGNLGFLDLFGSLSSESAKPEYLKNFFTETAMSLVQYAALAFLGYIILTKFIKGTTTWKQIVTAVGISLSVVIGANLINSILIFMGGEFIIHLISYVSSFASLFSILLLYESMKKIIEINQNKLLIAVVSMSVCATIVVDFIQKVLS